MGDSQAAWSTLERTHFGEWLKRRIEELELSQTDFAFKAEIKFWSLRNWIKSPAPVIRGKNMVRLARALGMKREDVEAVLLAAMRSDPETLARWAGQIAAVRKGGRSINDQIAAGAPIGEEEGEEETEEEPPLEIPEYDMSVAAGAWVDVGDVAIEANPQLIDLGIFRVKIHGDSMKCLPLKNCPPPEYADGDLVEFRIVRWGRDNMKLGRDYYVQRSDGMATFKRLEAMDEEKLVLRPLNRKKYPKPLTVEREQIVRLAEACAKITKLG